MVIPIIELDGLPKDEVRVLDMSEIRRRFARLPDEGISVPSEVTEDGKLRVTMSTPPSRFIDYTTGIIYE